MIEIIERKRKQIISEPLDQPKPLAQVASRKNAAWDGG